MRTSTIPKSLVIGIATCLAMSLGSCAPIPSASAPDADYALNAIGQRFVGRNVLEMSAVLGAPMRSLPLGELVIYSWERTSTMYFETRPPLILRCQLDAYVNQSGVVTNVGFSGQQGGCDRFLR